MGRLFGTAGIRGRYPDEVGPELAYRVALAVVTYVGARKVVVGGDGRTTTPVLKVSALAGVMAGGADAVDIGLTPMPVLPWAVRKLGGDAGIYITASHNPPTDNGIKVFSGEGREFFLREEDEVEKIIESGTWKLAGWDTVGSLSSREVIQEYLEELTEKLMPERVRRVPKVLVDTANGAASLTTPKLIKRLGASVVTINSNIDGYFPGRYPEPRPDVLEPFIPASKAVGADAYLAHDGDGDRLAVIDPAEGFIKQDRVIALIAKYKLMERRGTVIVSIDCGNAVKDVVEELGGKLKVVKLGKIHEGLSEERDAVVAAEPWKLIDPSWGPWIDGAYQAGFIVKLMMEEGVTLRELMKDIPNYPQARYSVKVPKGLRDEVFEYVTRELLSKAPETAEVVTIDGLRINYGDKSWLLVRKSGTEPKIRIYGEHLRRAELERMVNWVLELIKGYLESKGLKVVGIEGKVL